MTDGSYNPTEEQIITSVNEIIMLIASDDATQPVENVNIYNVAIQHGAWNIGRTQQADQFSAAFITSAALYIANATSIIISDIEISHTGLYAVWIKEGTTDIKMINSLVTDTGAGGIRIGQMVSPVLASTSSIKIISNEVCYGGNVFPSGVGINIHRAMDVAIIDNYVHHHRYSGIVVGWQLGYAPSYTGNILVQGNYVRDIGQHILCDQGGIYTLGIQPGTIIHGNVVKNVFSYAVFMWGIYLDEGSSDLIVSNNVVYNTGWASLFLHYGANNTIINNVFARASLYPPPQSGDASPDGDVRVERAENHTSWIFTRNIVYDLYQGANHSVFQSNPFANTIFTDNVYYNPYNSKLLFGWQQMPFDQWQKTGQDNDSVLADPLFTGDVNQCDFFTVQPNSPATRLGFVNLTKLTKWTPGCETVTLSDNTQFYHW